ncbi:MAG: DOMON domain-containing protein [Spirochaetia bacterium]|nr:DOMON domain-containing protein [Spirochaetia bacterium]
MRKTLLLLCVLLLISGMSVYGGGSKEAADEPLSMEELSALPGDAVDVIGMRLEWAVEGEEMLFSLYAPTTGWASIGIDPQQKMKGAQFVIGYVDEQGVPFIRDDYGTSAFGHKSDESLGGTNDLRIISGKEENGMLKLVFALPLESSDDKDVPLTLNAAHTIIFAYGADARDDFTSKHVKVGKAVVRF